MRLIDDQSRLFGLINPVDLLVVAIAVVAVLVVANVLFGVFEPDAGDLVDVEFEVVALGVRDFKPGQVTVGNEIHSSVAGRLGTIETVDSRPSHIEVLGPDGDPVVVDSELAQDVFMTVKAKGVPDSLGYLVGGVRIQNNSRVDIVTPGLEAERAYVSWVNEVGQR